MAVKLRFLRHADRLFDVNFLIHRISRLLTLGVFLYIPAGDALGSVNQQAISGYHPLLVAVTINGTNVSNGTLVMRSTDGSLLLPLSALHKWHIRKPAAQPVRISKDNYFSLAEIGVTSYKLNPSKQSISLVIPPHYFMRNFYNANILRQTKVTPAAFGGFIDYDVYGQHSAGANQEGGYFKIGAFSPLGVFTSSAIAQRGYSENHFIRLNSTWTSNFPSDLTSLKLGDFISQSDVSGNAVRMGGVQYGTDFSVQPYLVTTPLYSISGQASLPSVVSVYINHVLLSQRQVPSGPFVLQGLPVITGGGEITTVITNAIGQQQVITQPFFQSPNLLRPWLSNYSIAIGAIRENYAISSDDYGPLAATGTFEEGLSRYVTGGVHAAIEAHRIALGLSGTWSAVPVGVFSASDEWSEQHGEQGWLTSLGFQRLTTGFSFIASGQYESPEYTPLGYLTGFPLLQWQWNATLSHAVGRQGTLSGSFVAQKDYHVAATRIAQLNYNLSLGRFGYLTLTALHSFWPSPQTEFSAFWTIPLGSRSSASLSTQLQDHTSPLWTASLQRNLPVGSGYGYLAQLSNNQQAYLQGEYRGPYGTYTAQYQHVAPTSNSYRVEATGGIGIIDDVPFLTRTIRDSFALVQVPRLPDVTIYENNNNIGKTNDQGNLIVPQLQPYQKTQISVSPQDIPMNATLPVTTMPVVPPYLSGVIVRFPIKVSRSATFTVMQEDGAPVPAGATLQITSHKSTYPVGFNGSAYLSGLARENHVEARWPTGSCEFSITDSSTKIMPNLGTFACRPTTVGNGK